MAIEISFPRGGRKPPPEHAKKIRKKNDNLFDKQKPVKKPAKQPEQAVNKSIESNGMTKDTDVLAKSADLLTYRMLPDDIILLGCVREAKKMAVNVLLPGRLSGHAFITHISAPYSKLLQSIVDQGHSDNYKTLQQIFKPGQYVSVKVLKKESTDEKIDVSLSMLPSDINSDLSAKSLMVGMILWCAISSVEEHGYIIETGINNCRTFLPKSNIEKNTSYCVGEVLWCFIQKCEIMSGIATITMNAVKNKVATSKLMKETSLNNLLPGMMVDFNIETILTNGLEGSFLNNYRGYIHEGQLKNPLDTLTKFKIGQTVTARILYTMPITKFTYLTLKSFDIEERVLDDGQLINCQILSRVPGGFYLKIDKKYRGFVSYRRLKTPAQSDELLKKNYKINSMHNCRILSYDWMERAYMCSLEKDLCKGNVVTSKDVKVGQDVTVLIVEIQENGLLVKVGMLNGYILNYHLTDLVLVSYTNIKTKYRVGDQIKARIFAIKEDKSLMLTMKPSMLTDDNLMDYSQVEINRQFPGVITKVISRGVIVLFYGGVYGWVPKSQLSFEKVRPESRFQIGQVVKCTIYKYEPKTKNLILSLLPPKAINNLKLGEHVDGVVSRIIDGGIEIRVHHLPITAIIPIQHLTKCPTLANGVYETYNEDDTVTNLVCINLNKDLTILSMRDTDITESDILEFENIKEASILKCSVESFKKGVFTLHAPIKNFPGKIIVNDDEHIIEQWKTISKYQTVFAKVLQKNKFNNHLIVSINYKEFWQNDIWLSRDLLKNYLAEIVKLNTYWNDKHLPMAELKLGDVATGTVSEIDDDNCFVELTNGDTAFVDVVHRTNNLSVGDQVAGVVLWLDFVKKQVEISLKPSVMSRVNKIQDGNVSAPNQNIHADILLVKPDFVLVTLGPSKNRQLAFLPMRKHPNELEPDLSQYVVGEKIKVGITEKIEEKIIVLPSVQLKRLNKTETLEKKIKRKLESGNNDKSPKKKRKLNNTKTEENIESTKETNTKTRKRKKSQSETEKKESEEQHEDVPKKKKRRKRSKSVNANETVRETENADTSQLSNNSIEIKEKNKKSKKKNFVTTEDSEEITEESTDEVKTKTRSRRRRNSTQNLEDSQNETMEENNVDSEAEVNTDIEVDNEENIDEEVKTKKKKTKRKRKSTENLEEYQNEPMEENIEAEVKIKKKKTKKKRKSTQNLEESQHEIIEENNMDSEPEVNTVEIDTEKNIDAEVKTKKKKTKKKRKSTQNLEESQHEIIEENHIDSEPEVNTVEVDTEENIDAEVKTKKKKTKRKRKSSQNLEESQHEIIEENHMDSEPEVNTGVEIDTEENIDAGIKTKKRKTKRKRKSSQNLEESQNEIIEENNNDSEPEVNTEDSDIESNEKITSENKSNKKNKKFVLPSISNFWNVPETQNKVEDSSSEDEEEDDKTKLQRKKKMTPAERAEEARKEEERLRQIELELADTETVPKTVDHFDRSVMATPNNSLLWINYMAHHLEATEIEKARSVAKRALSVIEFREDQEKLNVWIAYLNLENRYGSKETFEHVLREAAKMNDSLTVHLQALNILSESHKSADFLELLMTVTKKFKQDAGMWIKAAEACHKCGMHNEAHNLMHRAMKSLEERQHINVLVQFALLESKYAEAERAEAILEKILASYPKRVDIWTSYVDMLIKGNRISIARNVLQRSVAQKLPVKKMKTLFAKFVHFETKYGDEENVKKVRQMAAEYVKTSLQEA